MRPEAPTSPPAASEATADTWAAQRNIVLHLLHVSDRALLLREPAAEQRTRFIDSVIAESTKGPAPPVLDFIRTMAQPGMDLAAVLAPAMSAVEGGSASPSNRTAALASLQEHLQAQLRAGRRPVLVVEEAAALERDVLAGLLAFRRWTADGDGHMLGLLLSGDDELASLVDSFNADEDSTNWQTVKLRATPSAHSGRARRAFGGALASLFRGRPREAVHTEEPERRSAAGRRAGSRLPLLAIAVTVAVVGLTALLLVLDHLSREPAPRPEAAQSAPAAGTGSAQLVTRPVPTPAVQAPKPLPPAPAVGQPAASAGPTSTPAPGSSTAAEASPASNLQPAGSAAPGAPPAPSVSEVAPAAAPESGSPAPARATTSQRAATQGPSGAGSGPQALVVTKNTGETPPASAPGTPNSTKIAPETNPPVPAAPSRGTAPQAEPESENAHQGATPAKPGAGLGLAAEASSRPEASVAATVPTQPAPASAPTSPRASTPPQHSPPPKQGSSDDWLRDQPADHYTIQVAGAYDRSSLERYARDTLRGRSVHIVRTRRQGREWFVAVTGSYATRQAAHTALAALPHKVRAAGAWVRTVGSLRK